MDIVVMMMKFKYLNGREAWEYMETLNITTNQFQSTLWFYNLWIISSNSRLLWHVYCLNGKRVTTTHRIPTRSLCLLRWSCKSYKPIRRLGSFLRDHHFQFGLAPRQSCTSLSGTVELKTWPSSSAANSENEL